MGMHHKDYANAKPKKEKEHFHENIAEMSQYALHWPKAGGSICCDVFQSMSCSFVIFSQIIYIHPHGGQT